MKARIVLLCLLFLTVPGLMADDSKTFNGEYFWKQSNHEGTLKAVFKKTAEQKWDVSFFFTFRGEDHTYTGTAEGNLSEGPLKGSVQNENKKRTWRFDGTFKEGKFSGDHVELQGEREVATGTLSLMP
jgi:hypothetical protein